MYSDKFGLADQGIDCAKLGYPTNPDTGVLIKINVLRKLKILLGSAIY
jgi:hypothetical protein